MTNNSMQGTGAVEKITNEVSFPNTTFTQFWDMHSGGGTKEKWEQIFIEASEEEAMLIFYNRFGHHPHDVACPCCGSNYSVSEYKEGLYQATGFHRNCAYDKVSHMYLEEIDKDKKSYAEYIPLEDYVQRDDVLVIFAKDILPEEKQGYLPEPDDRHEYEDW